MHCIFWISLTECTHSHADRETVCENAKLDATNHGLAATHGRLATFFVRFNCHQDPESPAISLADRILVLVVYLQRLFTMETAETWDPVLANVSYLFYGRGGRKHIAGARQAIGSISSVHQRL